MMYKLLVVAPSGKQEILEVSETGGYFDDSRVLWDERVDGELPATELGKMQRVGNELITLEDLLSAHADAVRVENTPSQVLMPAARIAMLRANVLDAVETFIATLGTEAVIWWQTSVYIRRDFPLVDAVRVEMGWTQEYIDDLFIAAAAIENENQ